MEFHFFYYIAYKYDHFFGPCGVITSPNYPGNYYNNISSTYYVHGSRYSGFAFIFEEDFHVQDYPDYLSVSNF